MLYIPISYTLYSSIVVVGYTFTELFTFVLVLQIGSDFVYMVALVLWQSYYELVEIFDG